MIALLVMTDGRADCITRTLASAREHLAGPITRAVIHDDSANPEYRCWLAETFPGYEIVGSAERQGFGGAIRNAWANLNTAPDDRGLVFHLEDDFVFTRPVDLAAMATVLDRNEHLVQLALRRQPWNDEERAAGGIIEQHPDDYTEASDGEHVWLEHRRFFTTNPSLYRRSLCRRPWPRGHESEGRFTHQLLASPKIRFGFWGSRDSGEWVEHIGQDRAGVGY